MATDEQFPPVQPQPGMSGGTKLLIGLSVGGLVLVFVCGTGAFFLIRAAVVGSRKMVANMQVRDPDKVREMTAQIADIDVPEEWEPVFASNMISAVGVFYQNENRELVLRLTQLNQAMLAGQPPQQMDHLREQTAQQLEMMYTTTGGGPAGKLKNINSESREIEVNGQTVEFEFATGEMGDDQTKYRRVTGDFQGKGGAATIMIQLPEDEFDDEAIEAILRSIGT